MGEGDHRTREGKRWRPSSFPQRGISVSRPSAFGFLSDFEASDLGIQDKRTFFLLLLACDAQAEEREQFFALGGAIVEDDEAPRLVTPGDEDLLDGSVHAEL